MPNIFRCFYIPLVLILLKMSAHVKTLEDEDKNKYNKLLSFYLNYELLKNIKAFGLKIKTCKALK